MLAKKIESFIFLSFFCSFFTVLKADLHFPYVQTKKFTVTLNNVTVKEVVAYVEKNSEFVFFYKPSLINSLPKINVKVKEATITQLLDQTLSQVHLKYEIKDRQIILKKADNTIENSRKQGRRKLQGIVKDEEGLPIIGASIQLKGTGTGTITDINGQFNIPVSGKDLSLPDLTKACLNNFQETAKKGFFMMVEGGKIDWAAHANDGGAVVKETIDFDQCIRLAYEFYKKHPNETLILVTADHETGGLGLGNSNMNLNIDLLQYQKCSQEALTTTMREMKSKKMIPSWEDMKAFLKKNLGFWEQITITPREELDLLICYEESFLKKKSKDVVSLYAKDEPLAAAAISLLDKKASIGWTTKSHTGAPVPLYVIGKQAYLYSGRKDNTDIPNILRSLFKLSE